MIIRCFCLTRSHSPKDLVVLLESMKGYHGGTEQNPGKNEDSYRESDLPSQPRLWAPPDQRQRQRPHAKECNDNKGFSKIPGNLFLCRVCVVSVRQELPAISALYSRILNFFGAKGAPFHCHLSWQSRHACLLGRSNSKTSA